jgi:YbbR domain-containing protein
MDMFKQLIQKNWHYKLLSVILAVGFWWWITLQSNPITLFGEQKITVPLVYYNQPANLAVVSNPNPVSIRLENIDQNNSSGIKNIFAYVDLNDAAAGEESYTVKIDAPEGLTVADISPQSLVIKLETVMDKVLPVEVKVTGAAAHNFEVGEPLVTPNVVSVHGPASLLAKLEQVSVSVELGSAREDMHVVRPVVLEGNLDMTMQNNTRIFPESVEVVIPILNTQLSVHTVPLQMELTGAPASGKELRRWVILPGDVQLYGTASALAEITSLQLPPLDISGLGASQTVGIDLAMLNLPEEVTLAEGTVINVVLTIVDAPINRVLEGVSVAVRNVPEGFRAVAVGEISVTVRGYPSIVNALTVADLTLWLNATPYSAGRNSVALSYDLPAGVTLVNPPELTLILEAATSEEQPVEPTTEQATEPPAESPSRSATEPEDEVDG